jgi:hypothetical protein
LRLEYAEMAYDKIALLFDLLTALAFLIGCSLIWLNRKAWQRNATGAKQGSVASLFNEEQRPAPRFVEEISIAPHLAPGTTLSEGPIAAGEGGDGDQNGYAAHVASAFSKSRSFHNPTSSR